MEEGTIWRVTVYDKPNRNAPNVNLRFSTEELARGRYKAECVRKPEPDRIYLTEETTTVLESAGSSSELGRGDG